MGKKITYSLNRDSMGIYCVPRLIVETGRIAVNKRNKSFALKEFTLLNHILKDHTISNVKNRLEAQSLVEK